MNRSNSQPESNASRSPAGEAGRTLDSSMLNLDEQAGLLDLLHDSVIVHDMAGRIIYWNRGARITYGWATGEAVGKVRHTLLRTQLGEPLAAIDRKLRDEGLWEGELVHTTRDGRKITVASRWVLWRSADGEPVGIVEVNNDITASKQLQRHDEMERRHLAEVLRLIPGYVAIKDRQYRLRFVNDGFVQMFGPPDDRPCYLVQYGDEKPCQACPLEAVIDGGKSLNWDFTYANGRTFQVWDFPFTDMDGSRVMLELGIDITEQREAERRVAEAAESERRLIGRDLHDSIGQNLTALGYMLEAYTNGDQVDDDLGQRVRALVRDCISQVRQVSHGLAPVGLESEGLAEALARLRDQMCRAHEIDCQFDFPAHIQVSEMVGTHLFRIAQEAVNNAIRHADASCVWLTLSQSPEGLTLVIGDNGVGIGSLENRSEGLGMRTMQYRATAIRARLQIASGADSGTLVRCVAPDPMFNLKGSDT